MRLTLIGGVLTGLLLFTPPAFAQAATVAVFAPTVTNPNAATPLSSAVYTPTCNLAVANEILPILNPVEGRYADPANATRDCSVNIAAQIAALPTGTGYVGAVKVGTGVYGPLSTAFAVAAAQVTHPCDATPASPASVNVAQSFTLGWCHAGTNVTGWRVYRNGVLVTGVTVTPGATANALGERYYTASRSEAAVATNVVFEVAGMNGVTEAARVAVPTLAVVQPPPPAPAAVSRPRVTVP